MEEARSRVVLISCGSKKREIRSKARDLYLGALIQKSIAYAESLGLPWVILSAKHGVLDPETRVDPYNVTLNEFKKPKLQAWATRTKRELLRRFSSDTEFVVLCGERYLSCTHGLRRVLPMKGLSIGRRLRWLNEQLGRKTLRGLLPSGK